MQTVVNPFKNSSHLTAACPFCSCTTNIQSAELRIDVGKGGVGVEYIPVSHVSTLNIYAPYMCEHCSGLFYFTTNAIGSKIETQIFFGSSENHSVCLDFEFIYERVDSNSIFFLRGAFGCGKTYCAMKILRNAPPKIKSMIIEADDASMYNQSAYDTLKNYKDNEAVALMQLQNALADKTDVIVICGVFSKLNSLDRYLERIEEAPIDYGIQVINLNHNEYTCHRQATKQMISDTRKNFEP